MVINNINTTRTQIQAIKKFVYIYFDRFVEDEEIYKVVTCILSATIERSYVQRQIHRVEVPISMGIYPAIMLP
jgi:hypothetical protein